MKDNISIKGYHITRDGTLYNTITLNKIRPSVHHSRGYLYVTLHIKDPISNKRIKQVHKYIHRLVAEAYIPNKYNKPCVCHKDNNRTNNHVDNLYWGTYKENSEQMVRDGRSLKGYNNPMYGALGEKHPISTISDNLRMEIILMYNNGIRICDIVRKLNIRRGNICSVIKKYKKGIYGIKVPHSKKS